jgi:hypothetical protein
MKNYTTAIINPENLEIEKIETSIPEDIVKTIHNSLFGLEAETDEGVILVAPGFIAPDGSSVYIPLIYHRKKYKIEISVVD